MLDMLTAVRTEDSAIDPRIESVLTPGLDSKSLSTLTFGLSSVLHATSTSRTWPW